MAEALKNSFDCFLIAAVIFKQLETQLKLRFDKKEANLKMFRNKNINRSDIEKFPTTFFR